MLSPPVLLLTTFRLLVGSGALAQGSTSKYGFLANRKDQNVLVHQKSFGGTQMSLREAYCRFEASLRALNTILPESDPLLQKSVRRSMIAIKTDPLWFKIGLGNTEIVDSGRRKKLFFVLRSR